ncbi:APC family permease [Erythrobacter sp. SD-21]|uniref:APC family permease n=1 Tax=Erythrobacter sp. SD-21 TaxID=161528 RepID=UPI000153F19D|nr:APC family permease [Erythrobacter sp. SD-21]EDL48953.1 cationic amino acid transporter [Erythrobacter sp. SD-21]
MDGKPIAPPRTVGFAGMSLLQINGMIGSGIFALPAVLVAGVGSFAPVLMLLGGVLFLPLALVFAWLAARFEMSGGPVLYGKTAFGSFAGFQAGWGRYVSGSVAMAANTHVMVAYFAAIFPVLQDPFWSTVTAVAVIAALTIINLFSMRGSVNALGGLTALKLVPLAILIGAALLGNFGAPEIVLPEFSQVETVVLLLFYAFIGFEGVTVPAGELKNPKRDLPRVLVTVLAGVTVLYAIIIWAYLAIGASPNADESALAASAQAALGDLGTLMIVLGAGFSILANSFSGVVVVPRMAYGMAQQGMLPEWFERIHPRFLTPANAILFYGAASCLFAMWGGFLVLAAASTLSRLLTYVITAAALPVIEKREGHLNPFRAFVALLALAASVWISSHASEEAWTIFGILLAVGTLLYFVARRGSVDEPIAESS